MKITGGEMTQAEIQAYRDYAKEHHPDCTLEGLKIIGDEVELELRPIPIERIRRITGYLTGDTSGWNDAKKAELEARVKHD